MGANFGSCQLENNKFSNVVVESMASLFWKITCSCCLNLWFSFTRTCAIRFMSILGLIVLGLLGLSSPLPKIHVNINLMLVFIEMILFVPKQKFYVLWIL